jgi:iron complex transport system substrate-binding protein
MRIASLVPSATEMLYALGLGDSVVGVTHECDYPAQAGEKPHLTRSVIPPDLAAADIDREVRERTERGEAIYELDSFLLTELRPDLIVTQQVCEVCAVSFDDVSAVAQRIPSQPQVLSLDPSTIGEVLADMRTLGAAADASEAAEELLADAADRLDSVQEAVADAAPQRVLALEWLDPPYAGGHWVPQMVELAGGFDALGLPGERSRVFEWAEAEAARPEVVVSMPCGYGAERAAEETRPHLERLASLGARRVVAVDASSYFSRPGPRLVDGVELLAHVLHPERVPAPPPGRLVELDVSTALAWWRSAPSTARGSRRARRSASTRCSTTSRSPTGSAL